MSPKKNKKSKPKPIDLKLTLENFGPLRKAEIDLKPMTIFIGPNNSGKSYAAMMFYSIFQVLARAGSGPLLDFEVGKKRIESLSRLLAGLSGKGTPDSLSPEFLRELGRAFEPKLRRELRDDFASCYCAQPDVLVRSGTDEFRFDVRTPELDISLKGDRRTQKLELALQPGDVPFMVPEDVSELLRSLKSPQREFSFLFVPSIYKISETVAERMFQTFDRELYYQPASRSGIMQGRRQIAMEAQGLTVVKIIRGQMPCPSNVVLSFIRNLLTSRTTPGPLLHIARDMEQEMISGAVHSKPINDNSKAELWYEFGDTQILLERGSSALSELAPLILLVKSLLHPKDILVIEEPEAHLHPGAIRILAKYLVKLVREGVNLILTTHSDYLLGQINNYILAGSVRQKAASRKLKEDANLYLESKDVACYLFKAGETPEEGFSTEELKAEEDGFPEEEFTKVARAMYNQSARLRNRLIPEKRLADVAKG